MTRHPATGVKKEEEEKNSHPKNRIRLKFLPFFLFFFLFLPKAEVVFALAPDAGDHGLEGRCEVTLDRKAAVWRRAPLEVLVIVNIALVHDALESEKSHRVRLEQGKEKEERRKKKKKGYVIVTSRTPHP